MIRSGSGLCRRLYGALVLLRFLWVWASLRFTLFRAARKVQKAVCARLAPDRGHIAGRRARNHHFGGRDDPASDDERWVALSGNVTSPFSSPPA